MKHVGVHNRHFGYVGRRPYTFDGLHQSFNSGDPPAVFGSYNGEYQWYPVLYVDDEGGVTVSKDNEPLFLTDFEDIQEQCVFTLWPRQRERSRS
jgi:hypothetical protein